MDYTAEQWMQDYQNANGHVIDLAHSLSQIELQRAFAIVTGMKVQIDSVTQARFVTQKQ